jgi:hypothetical protein
VTQIMFLTRTETDSFGLIEVPAQALAPSAA